MIHNNPHSTQTEKARYRFVDAVKLFIGSFVSSKQKTLQQKPLKIYIPLAMLDDGFPFPAESMQLKGNNLKNWLQSIETAMFADFIDCKQDAISRRPILSVKIHRLGSQGTPAVKLKVYCSDGQWIPTESMVSTTYTRQYSLYNPDFSILYDDLSALGAADAFIEKIKEQKEKPKD